MATPKQAKQPWGGHGIHIATTDGKGPVTPHDMSTISDEDWAILEAAVTGQPGTPKTDPAPPKGDTGPGKKGPPVR